MTKAQRKSVASSVSLAVLLCLAPAAAVAGEIAAADDSRMGNLKGLSSRQLAERAESHVKEMRQLLGQVRRMLEDAREEKDVIKLNCVNDRLTHLRGLVRVSEQGQLTMQRALLQSRMDEARHELTKIIVALDRVRQLRAESEECVGLMAFVVDEELDVQVDVPEGLPDVVTRVSTIEPVSVRPPMASRVE